jgi:LexA-binding, inner membrane-associated putative hydrolase
MVTGRLYKCGNTEPITCKAHAPNLRRYRAVVTFGMYPIAHVVVACGAAYVAEQALRQRQARARHTETAVGGFDYRLVALGALLPDIIDKPLAWFLLFDRVEDDHLLAHTLIFGIVLAVAGLILASRGDWRLASIAFGVLLHRLCDPIWPELSTVLWPLYGWNFEHSESVYFAAYAVLEVLATAVLVVVLRRLWLRDRLSALISDGRI